MTEEATIAAFLHASRLGLFELVVERPLPRLRRRPRKQHVAEIGGPTEYICALCAAGYEATLDEMVEVTFTVSPRVRRIAAHDPHTLPMVEYMRQIFWGSGVDLPDDATSRRSSMRSCSTTSKCRPARRRACRCNCRPSSSSSCDPVTHSVHFIDVKGDPTRERQSLTVVMQSEHAPTGTTQMQPGPLRITLENRTNVRTLPSVWIAGDKLHDLLGHRRPFLTAKRLLTNQTFRDIYRTDTLDINQRLKITSLTFLFTDLKGSTELYDRVGDLVAYDLVRAHFGLLTEIVAAEAGAVVKTIGDAVMATFPTPDRAIAAALRMRDALRDLNRRRDAAQDRHP